MTRLQRKVLLFLQEQQDDLGNSVTVSRITEETRRAEEAAIGRSKPSRLERKKDAA